MSLDDFEKCFIDPFDGTMLEDEWTIFTFRDWFNKHSSMYQGSYDISQRSRECLREIYSIWIKENRKPRYFWITQDKVEHEDYNMKNPDVSIGSIRLSDKVLSLYRDSKIDEILKSNFLD